MNQALIDLGDYLGSALSEDVSDVRVAHDELALISRLPIVARNGTVRGIHELKFRVRMSPLAAYTICCRSSQATGARNRSSSSISVRSSNGSERISMLMLRPSSP